MKRKYWVLGIIGGVLAAIGLAVAYVLRESLRLPDNNLEKVLQNGRKSQGQLVVCAGDSNTHGRVSANYVNMLAETLGPQGFDFVNAGINWHQAYNLMRRLDLIVALQPEVVVVMIGTNDVNASLHAHNKQFYIQHNSLPEVPDINHFRRYLEHIVNLLQHQTNAHIALVSIPVLGEALDSEANRCVHEYNQVVKAVAEEQGVVYLPLYEKQVELLKKTGHYPSEVYNHYSLKILLAPVQRYLLRRNWDDISRNHGLLLTVDHLHFNNLSASLLTNLVVGFLHDITAESMTMQMMQPSTPQNGNL